VQTLAAVSESCSRSGVSQLRRTGFGVVEGKSRPGGGPPLRHWDLNACSPCFRLVYRYAHHPAVLVEAAVATWGDLDRTDVAGWTCLMWAVALGLHAVVKALLAASADPSCTQTAPAVLVTTVDMTKVEPGTAWPLVGGDEAGGGDGRPLRAAEWWANASCAYAGACMARGAVYAPHLASLPVDAPATLPTFGRDPVLRNHGVMWFDAGDGVIDIASKGAGTVNAVPSASTVYLWLQHQYGIEVRRLAAYRRLVLASATEPALAPDSPVGWLDIELQRVACLIGLAAEQRSGWWRVGHKAFALPGPIRHAGISVAQRVANLYFIL
jgi:hypothetical protein